MIVPILIIVNAAAGFVAGALYGRQAEAKAIAAAMRLEAGFHSELLSAISHFRQSIASLKAHL